MGYKEIDIRVSVYTDAQELKDLIRRKCGIDSFHYSIVRKSLDARNKRNICWEYRFGILSDKIPSGALPEPVTLEPVKRNGKKHVVVTGTGPAGIFSALFLALSGVRVTLIERGSMVENREKSISRFEANGEFDPANNYAFGEGGAGTFSDGKLTSRTKSIRPERNFIFQQLIEAGAPDEIFYMTHPHLGSDNLFQITKNFRSRLISMGCTFLFNTRFEELVISNKKVMAIRTDKGTLDADAFIMATGHSAHETCRSLIQSGVHFYPKNFALGFRAEHRQEVINRARWGVPELPGVKAAEYRLTSKGDEGTGVYSFCMCPGGKVVPAMAYEHTQVVNGMSNYMRNSKWANAAVVAAMNPEQFFGKPVSAMETLDWLEQLESRFYEFARGYDAPATLISTFLNGSKSKNLSESSYPFPLIEADFRELFPERLIRPLQTGLKDFCRKLKGYETGLLLGLESKTSSPVQVERHPSNLNSVFDNLYIVGEGSGRAGGIVSSAADGLKIAQKAAVN